MSRWALAYELAPDGAPSVGSVADLIAAVGDGSSVKVVMASGMSTCADLSQAKPGFGPNPLPMNGIEFEVLAPPPASQTRVWTGGSGNPLLGLECFRGLAIRGPQPWSGIELTLIHFAFGAVVTALDANGPVAKQAMTVPKNQPEKITLGAANIDHVVVEPPQGETLVLACCCTDAAVQAFVADTLHVREGVVWAMGAPTVSADGRGTDLVGDRPDAYMLVVSSSGVVKHVPWPPAGPGRAPEPPPGGWRIRWFVDAH